jgi:diacylglycerol kinase family enzyme
MSSWLGIVNPTSGGRGVRRAQDLASELERWGVEAVLTERPGHATELARAGRGCEGLVVVGGDGTIFEVLQGLESGAQALCIVPTGRGNSLARDLGLYPLRFPRESPALSATRSIDLLEVAFERADGRRARVQAASTVAVGYPAEVVARAGRLRSLGRLSYPAAAALVGTRPRRMRIRCGIEDLPERALTGLLVSNTRHAASFDLFPRADCGDGRFEWMELVDGRAGQLLHNLSALSGVPFHVPPSRCQASELRVALDEPQDLLVDGELIAGVRALEVRIVPGALRICSGGPG